MKQVLLDLEKYADLPDVPAAIQYLKSGISANVVGEREKQLAEQAGVNLDDVYNLNKQFVYAGIAVSRNIAEAQPFSGSLNSAETPASQQVGERNRKAMGKSSRS